MGKGDAEDAGGFDGILLVGLIEVTDTEEKQGIGMLGLQVTELAHDGAVKGLHLGLGSVYLLLDVPHMLLKPDRFVPDVEVHIAATLTMKAHVIAFLLQLDDNLRRTLGLTVIDPDTHEGKAVLGPVSLEVHQVDVLIRGGAVNLADPVRLTAAVDLHVRRNAAPSVGGSVIVNPVVLLSTEGFLLHRSGSLLLQIVMDDHEAALVIQQLEAVALTALLLHITDERIKGCLLLLGEIRQLLLGENLPSRSLASQLPDGRVQLIREAFLPLVHDGRDEI